MDVVGLLSETVSRYVDPASRNAVERLAMELVKRDEQRESKYGVVEQVIGWLLIESRSARKYVRDLLKYIMDSNRSLALYPSLESSS